MLELTAIVLCEWKRHLNYLLCKACRAKSRELPKDPISPELHSLLSFLSAAVTPPNLRHNHVTHHLYYLPRARSFYCDEHTGGLCSWFFLHFQAQTQHNSWMVTISIWMNGTTFLLIKPGVGHFPWLFLFLVLFVKSASFPVALTVLEPVTQTRLASNLPRATCVYLLKSQLKA